MSLEISILKKPKRERDWIKFWETWKMVKEQYRDLGLTEQKETLGKMYGVTRRTVDTWMKDKPPIVEVYTKAERFLQIPFVAAWYEDLKLEPIREASKRSTLKLVSSVWEILGKDDPRLWDKTCIKKIVDAWIKQGLSESTIKNYKVLLRRFLMGVPIKSLNDLAKALPVGAIAKRRGSEEIFHEPLTREQFELLVEKTPEVCTAYYEEHPGLFTSGEWLCKLIDVAFHLAVFSGVRTGDYKQGRDMLGIRVVTDPAKIPKVATPAGAKEVAHLIYSPHTKKIIKWKILAKWYLHWTKLMLPRFVETKLIEWIEFAGLKHGDALFPLKSYIYRRIIRRLSEACKFPFYFSHHNLRSTNLSWMCESDIPLEVAVEMGVGWDTIQTAKDFYLKIRRHRFDVEFQKLLRYIGEKT